jgi:hypothetical protein
VYGRKFIQISAHLTSEERTRNLARRVATLKTPIWIRRDAKTTPRF